MPSALETPVLQVDANVIHKVDTTNHQNLFNMWSVFARCGDAVAEGRRLENLSWRLLTRETFHRDADSAQPLAQPPQPLDSRSSQSQQKSRSSADDIPKLSGSVESLADDEAVELSSDAHPLDIARPRIQRQDSSSSTGRLRERHISSGALEKMVLSIVDQKASLDAPLPTLMSAPVSAMPPKDEASDDVQRSGSTTTEASVDSTDADVSELPSTESLGEPARPIDAASSQGQTTVVRGFSPSQTTPSRIVTPAHLPKADPIPEPESAPAAKPVASRRPAKFALGGSSSGDEESLHDSSVLEAAHKPPVPVTAPPKHKMFQVGGSSEEDGSLKSALMHSSRPNPMLSAQKKQASFSNHVTTRTIPDTSAISDDDSDYVDESAIDDEDDSSDWEDSAEDSGRSSIEDKNMFQRVDSKANLTSHRSLLSLMIEQQTDGTPKRPGAITSQSTSALHRARAPPQAPAMVASPNDSDDAPLMMKRGPRGNPLKPINEIPRSSAQPINPSGSSAHFQAALSPRTTRRNMLSTELTESLRRHLLWERKQKSSTANAVLKRRHTSHDVANLKQFPEKPYMKQAEDVNASSWDHDFSREAHGGYHSKGW